MNNCYKFCAEDPNIENVKFNERKMFDLWYDNAIFYYGNLKEVKSVSIDSLSNSTCYSN